MVSTNGGEAADAMCALRRQHRAGGDLREIDVARRMIAASLFGGLGFEAATVGRYVLRRRLGAGGMGIVFLAHDPSLDREVAIKLLHPAAAHGADTQLLTEAQNAARLVHPAVVTMFDAGLHEGRVFIAMEVVAGQSMSEWLPTSPSWQQCVAALAKAARGLEAAHDRGIIHRDFKPANVLLGRDGRVCVADFGLARRITETGIVDWSLAEATSADTVRVRTRAGDIAGTPAYMAPEQYLGTEQDARSDQFAFCVTLFEALFGHRPFDGETLQELMHAVLHAEPAIPSVHAVPDAIVRAVLRGLSKARHHRFNSMGELAALLEANSEGVDLAVLLGDPIVAAHEVEESAFQRYVAQLPEGLDTSPEQVLPSRIYQVALAKRPLARPPAELLQIIEDVGTKDVIPAVHARALLAAIYDEHFESLDQWRDFVAQMSQGFITLFFTNFSLPPPSSVYFMQGLAGLYNNVARGIGMEIIDTARWTATFRVRHPPKTLNDVARVALEEMLRATIVAAGCRIADFSMLEIHDDSVVYRVDWR